MRDMRLGLSSFTYTWAVGVPGFMPDSPMTHRALLARATELGVDVVQFADNLPLERLSTAAIDEIVADAIDRGIDIELGTRGIGVQLDRYVRLAAQFGSSFVRIVVDGADDHPTPEQVVNRLRGYEPLFREGNLALAIENHDRFTCAQLIGILDELGDWVGICLDTVNSFGALETPEMVVRELGPRAINLHVKDFTIRRHPHQMGFEVVGTPAGQGLLNVPWLVGELKHTAVRTAILELWTPPEPALEATIVKEAEWAEVSVAYLRTMLDTEVASVNSEVSTA